MSDRPFIFSRDPEKKRENDRAYKARNREAILARRRAAYAENAEALRAKQAEKRRARYEAVLAYNKAYSVGFRRRLRDEMIAAYGGACVCCGEREPTFLQLDHIHNDGHLDRRRHKTSAKLWAALKRAGWPRERHQLLCANCNFGKLMNGGRCPHEDARHGR